MKEDNLILRPRVPGKYVLTNEDLEYIKSFAVDGVIPFNDYIKAVNEVLNK